MRSFGGMNPPNGSWVEIEESAVIENAQAVMRALPEGVRLIAVVKSDAYGHCLHPFAKALRKAGVRDFALAYAAEAETVRDAVPDARLLLVLGGADASDVPMMLAKGITPVVPSAQAACAFGDAALAAGGVLPVQLKLDTGMGRLGFLMPQLLPDALSTLRVPGISVEGLCAHFAIVEPQRNPQAAALQMEKYRAAAQALEAAAGKPLFKDVSSSRAALLMPDCDNNGVRVGIALYGYGAADPAGRFRTRPVLQWKTRVVQVRDVPAGMAVGYYGAYKTTRPTKLAVLSCGYADGYNRHLGNIGHVLVGGRRCLVAGRVSMNWISVDLGPNADVHEGDEAVLIGRQGDAEIWADELARHCGTIAYEILTGISSRIERRYV